MKSLIRFVLMAIVFSLLVGCKAKEIVSDEQPNEGSTMSLPESKLSEPNNSALSQGKYYMTVTDAFGLLYELPPTSYTDGATVTIKLRSRPLDKAGILVNGVAIEPIDSENFSYVLFEFVMPKYDIVLETIFLAGEPEQITYFKNEKTIIYYITFKLNEDGSEVDYQDFIELSGLNNFDYESVYYRDYSKVFVVTFSDLAHTPDTEQFMENLINNEFVLSVNKNEEYHYALAYMHNPLYYGLTDKEKVEFSLTVPYFLPKGIYKSIKEVHIAAHNYLNEFSQRYPSERAYFENYIALVLDKYDKEYFKNNILIVTDMITTGSGSNRQELNSVYLKNNIIYLFTEMYFPFLGTCDMQSTVFGLTVSKDNIPNLNRLKQWLLYSIPECDLPGLWGPVWDKVE